MIFDFPNYGAFMRTAHKKHLNSWRLAYLGVALPNRYNSAAEALTELNETDPMIVHMFTAVSPSGARLTREALACLI